MDHISPLWAALRDALNLTGVAALITGIFLITKGRTDARLLLKQLEQKQKADDRDDDRDDAKLISDRMAAAAGIMDRTALAAAADAEVWRLRYKDAQKEIDERNSTLAKFGTNAPEMFDLMAVPGAMALLRSHRDKYTSAHS